MADRIRFLKEELARAKLRLKSSLEDEDSRKLLQVWFGYCLVQDTRLQKMMMIVQTKTPRPESRSRGMSIGFPDVSVMLPRTLLAGTGQCRRGFSGPRTIDARVPD